VIWEAISAGFTSVMIDASEKDLAENIAVTRQVVETAHQRGVSVEAELGRIGTTDHVETDEDVEFYTQPGEARRFVDETGVDALAVSVGTAHGVYQVRQPKIDYERLKAIHAETPVPLVIHGGSGIPAAMLLAAYRLPGGGVSKVNIATDLEMASLQAMGRTEYLTDAALKALPREQLRSAQAAVEAVVAEKIREYLGSAGKALVFGNL
ncbi:MAG TPA: class II fructose-bisphosphate aldolase, partial [Anaerolineaceae bacterium]|nr:class II fructose-bisphosphate aldolase [Anaerolineaceae bacterium]